jgi:hypothetical protein
MQRCDGGGPWLNRAGGVTAEVLSSSGAAWPV